MSIGHAEMQALAQRAVSCKRWRLLPGMRLATGRLAVRLLWVGTDGDWLGATGGGARIHCTDEAWLPDLTDPATLGCLLALVREAWGDPEAYTRTQPRGGASVWTVYIKTVGAQIQRGPAMNAEGDMLYGPTEAHALVAALEVVR